MTNKTQTEVTMQVSTNSIGNDVLHYNGFKIDYQIACDSCDCCGTRHELTWGLLIILILMNTYLMHVLYKNLFKKLIIKTFIRGNYEL